MMYFFSSTNSGAMSQRSPGSSLNACSSLSFLLVIMGPTMLPAFHTPPTLSDDAQSVSFSKNSGLLYTERSTSSNEQAEHFCPALPKAERQAFMMAWSRSPLAERIITFLPPVSAESGLRGLVWAMLCAVSVPPVRMMCLMTGDEVSNGVASRLVIITCKASLGTPASQNALAKSQATGAATVAGFSTQVLPDASAATTPPHGMAHGKFQGESTSTVPLARISISSRAAYFFIVVV